MTSDNIFRKKGSFYYPFTKPLTGNITDLCTNPTKYGCSLNTDYQTKNCGLNSKPVLDCGVDTSAVCCPEKIFPYAKTTKYCTYLNNQGCFKHQKYEWPYRQGPSIPCPSDTYNISDCGLCCPRDITSNMNFTSDPYDPLKNNIVGNLWNKDDAELEDGIYKITINDHCAIVENSVLTMYKNSPSGYSTGQYPGDCGGAWIITKMTERYLGKGIYPSSDMKYVPGGYTLYNNIYKLYLSLKTFQYGHGVSLSLSPIPTVVNIFKNSDNSFRIQNAKNQLASFSKIGNIGNPISCVILDQNGNFKAYNWGNGLSGLPCGINNGVDENSYKFQFTKVTDINKYNIPATLPNGEYYIEVENYDPFVNKKNSNKCIDANGNMSNFGGDSGICGTLVPRFRTNKSYKWILTNENGGGFSLQNETDGKYLQEPEYGKNLTVGTDKAILNIFVNSDNSLRITSTDLIPICAINTDNVLMGYNWNINTLECGTGPNSTIINYRFNFVPVPEVIIPPVSDLPNGEGIYEIHTGTDEGVVFDQETGGGLHQYQDGVGYVVKDTIPNILEMSSRFSHTLYQTRWKINKAIDSYGDPGYTVQNVASNRYLTLSVDFNKILTTTDTKTVLFLYTNPDGSYTFQDRSGACLNRSKKLYSSSWRGDGEWDYYYTTFRENQSSGACGMSSPSANVVYTLKFIDPSPTMKSLGGNGGNCTYTWYNPDLSTTIVSGFSDQITCNTAITTARQNASFYNVDNVDGRWQPFFNDNIHILYGYGGKCMSVDDNDNVVASPTCTKTGEKSQKWYWTFTPEKINDIATGNYFVVNRATGKYLTVPNIASTNTLTTTSTPTAIGIRLTYPTYGDIMSTYNSGIIEKRLKPTSYYFHFVNPDTDSVCAYTNNIIFQSITWGSNTGLVSGYPAAPIEQQQRAVVYECGTDPNKFTITSAKYDIPNPNYQFTVDGYCLNDFILYSGMDIKLCFNDDGTVNN